MPTSPSASVAFSTLPPEAQREHRSRLGIRVMAILNSFWVSDRTPDAVQAIEIEGWLDVLEGLTEDEVRTAWSNYQKNGPRNDRHVLKRPDPGALHDMAMRHREFLARQVKRAAPPPPPPPPEPSPGDKARVDAVTKRFANAASMQAMSKAPLATSFAEAEVMAEAPPPRHWTDTATPEQLAQLEAARAANPAIQAARAAMRGTAKTP